jgi:hypothetical protein
MKALHLAKCRVELSKKSPTLGSLVNGPLDSGWLSVCSSASLALQLVAANSALPLELAVVVLEVLPLALQRLHVNDYF